MIGFALGVVVTLAAFGILGFLLYLYAEGMSR